MLHAISFQAGSTMEKLKLYFDNPKIHLKILNGELRIYTPIIRNKNTLEWLSRLLVMQNIY